MTRHILGPILKNYRPGLCLVLKVHDLGQTRRHLKDARLLVGKTREAELRGVRQRIAEEQFAALSDKAPAVLHLVPVKARRIAGVKNPQVVQPFLRSSRRPQRIGCKEAVGCKSYRSDGFFVPAH